MGQIKHLYHGSRGGIVGDIKPESRSRCDFGRGFYMGTNKDQARTLVANDQVPYLYKLDFDLSTMEENRILTLSGMEWAFFVLYNRDRLGNIKGSELYNNLQHLADGKDVIIGPIADDAMNEAMTKFTESQITDKAFLESISALDYGTQYVAKTQEACSCITVISEKEMRGKELQDAMMSAILRRKEGSVVADKMQKLYRREGRYFDEILHDIRKSLDRGLSRE